MSTRRLRIAGGSLLLILTLFGAYQLFWPDQSEVVREVFVTAPEFSLPGMDGNPVALGDVSAEVRVVNFWASWSPYSSNELRDFARLKDAYGDRVAIIALSRDTNIEDGRTFVRALGLGEGVTFVFDQEDAYFKKVRGFAVPETLFLDENENIRHHAHGPLTYEVMQQVVERLLAEGAAPAANS
jgi:peroxiredoxin